MDATPFISSTSLSIPCSVNFEIGLSFENGSFEDGLAITQPLTTNFSVPSNQVNNVSDVATGLKIGMVNYQFGTTTLNGTLSTKFY